MILNKYSNQLVQEIIRAGLNVSDLKFDNRHPRSIIESVVISYDRIFSFTIQINSTDFNKFKYSHTLFKPSLPNNHSSGEVNFIKLKDAFIQWLNNDLIPYIENKEEPDYWSILSKHPLKFENIDFAQNTPFSNAEKVQLKIGFEEVKLLVAQNLGLNNAQIETTNKKLDYLIEATERLNKTDWKGVAISTMFSISSELMLDEQKRATFFGLFSKLWAIAQHLPNLIH